MVLLDAPGAACCSSSVVASAAVPWSVPWRTNKQLAGRAVVLGDPKVLTGSSEWHEEDPSEAHEERS
jgi:hypothetical protein